ncbi:MULTISPECIES: DUF6773 family protein [Clostridium]|uniref:DUF6773 family protein n=1 Tax=Clostridium TaxID=1485 RepID=UPI000CF71979|nr:MULTISPECIES: DUF6773 family protein [Clostridium]
MKKILDDERMYLEVQKIYANGFKIIITCLVLDFLYNMCIKKESYTDNMDKTIILLIAFSYIIIILIKGGLFNINLKENNNNKIFILFTSTLSTIVFTILMNLNEEIIVKKVVVMGIVFFVVITIFLSLFTKLSQKRH